MHITMLGIPTFYIYGTVFAVEEMAISVAIHRILAARKTTKNDSGGPRFFSLIIGIDKYVALDNLQGSVNDATDFKNFLRQYIQVPEHSIRILLDEQATRSQILQHFDELFLNESIVADDVLIFYFAGHGSHVPFDTTSWPTNLGRVETICPVDDNSSDEENGELVVGIPDVTLNAKFRQLRSDNIVIILDCCFSGGMARGPYSELGRVASIRNSPIRYDNLRVRFSDYERMLWSQKPCKLSQFRGERSRVVLAASGEGERANEYTVDGRVVGVFTNTLLRTLRSIWAASPSITYLDLTELIRLDSAVRAVNQKPACYGLNKDRWLFSKFSRSQLSPEPVFLLLDKGRNQGITPGKCFVITGLSHRAVVDSVEDDSSLLKVSPSLLKILPKNGLRRDSLFGTTKKNAAPQLMAVDLSPKLWLKSCPFPRFAVFFRFCQKRSVALLFPRSASGNPPGATAEAAVLVRVGRQHGVTEESRFVIPGDGDTYLDLRVHRSYKDHSILLFNKPEHYGKALSERVLWLDYTIRMHILQPELKSLLECFPLPNITLVQQAEYPSVAVSFDEGRKVLQVKRFDPLFLQLYGKEAEGFHQVELPLADDVEISRRLNDIAHFHYYLALRSFPPSSVERPIQELGMPQDPGLDFHLYEIGFNYREGSRFPKDDKNYFLPTHTVTTEAYYGMRLVNNRAGNLYPAIFCFNPDNYMIELYRQCNDEDDPLFSTASRQGYPVDFTIGYGPGGGNPVKFSPGERNFFKLFVAGEFYDLKFIETARRREGGRLTRSPSPQDVKFTGAWVFGVTAGVA